MNKTCCIIGHKSIAITDELKKSITDLFIYLIEKENVGIFLIGDKSEFNSLCHVIVYNLKHSKYNFLKLIGYSSPWRSFVLGPNESYGRPKCDEDINLIECYNAGKASYAYKNCQMINKSDFCVFYYDENYLPPRRKYSKRDLFEYNRIVGQNMLMNMLLKKRKRFLIFLNQKTSVASF